MKEVMMGDVAVARGVKLARVEVIAAYPITPQTIIVEELSEICGRGELKARFIKVESEHSALACCMGASMAGARTFTASASQGLLLMHEMLHWSAGARTPIVMANVNRAIAPPWNLWSDQTDSLSQRDTSWIQLYCENNQEVIDTVIQAYRIAETVYLPVMVVLDAFILSHTSEVVAVPEQEDVDRYLPPFKAALTLDTNDPRAFGSISGPIEYQKLKMARHEDMMGAVEVARRADIEFGEIFGRKYGIAERYRCEDAELILLTSGALGGTAKIAVDALRESGAAVGALRVRLFRPFPADDIADAIGGAPKVAVIDRNLSVGAGGIFAQELKAALYDRERRPAVFGFTGGYGGGDFTPEVVEKIARRALEMDKPDSPTLWEAIP
ncbi:MAG TPA: pyruvate ferredoxin oxidoreductase [bacterium]|nr:pyruvate ferredoxin oxidoreductase [bacterium]